MNRYYSSAVPTTQGLNATFRSHLIMDKDISGKNTPSLFRSAQAAGMRGIFMNASSQYYANELREYPTQFGMNEYYAKEYLEKQGYTGASGWGFHNDVMYEETLKLLEKAKAKNDRLVMVTKTLDMRISLILTPASAGTKCRTMCAVISLLQCAASTGLIKHWSISFRKHRSAD